MVIIIHYFTAKLNSFDQYDIIGQNIAFGKVNCYAIWFFGAFLLLSFGMRIPFRKPGKFSSQKNDPFITREKFEQLEKDLDRLKNIARPKLAAEVARLAELGDFSENGEYQLAKGKLRGTNNAILKLEAQIRDAEIIDSSGSDVIEKGSVVTVKVEGIEKTFQILGSEEARPDKGVISYSSPLGAALIGKEAGESITMMISGKEKVYFIKKVS